MPETENLNSTDNQSGAAAGGESLTPSASMTSGGMEEESFTDYIPEASYGEADDFADYDPEGSQSSMQDMSAPEPAGTSSAEMPSPAPVANPNGGDGTSSATPHQQIPSGIGMQGQTQQGQGLGDFASSVGQAAETIAQGTGAAFNQARQALNENEAFQNASTKVNEISKKQVPLGKVLACAGTVVLLLIVLGTCSRSCSGNATAPGGNTGFVRQNTPAAPAYTTLEGYFQLHPDEWANMQKEAASYNISGMYSTACAVSGNTFSYNQTLVGTSAPQDFGDRLLYGLMGGMQADSLQESMSNLAQRLETKTGLTGIICEFNQYGSDGSLINSVVGAA